MSHESVTPPERERLTTAEPKRKPRWGRRILATLGVLVLVLAVLVVLAPMIAAPFVRDAIAGTRDDGTTVDVGTLKLSWTGAQRVEHLVVTDAAGDQIADLDASFDRSLLDLLKDRNDLGTLTLSGSARLKNAPEDAPGEGESKSDTTSGDTSVTVQRDFANLAAALNITSLDLTIDRPDGDPILARLKGTAALAPGQSPNAQFHADVTHNGRTAPVDLTVSGVDLALDGSSALPVRALAANLTATQAPVAMLDALANQGGRLTALLGEAADANATLTMVSPGVYTADANLTATSAQANAQLKLEDGSLTASAPVTLRLDTAGALALPGVAESLTNAGLAFTDAPAVTLTLTELRLPVDTDPKSGLPRAFDAASFDASRASMLARIEIAESRAQVPGSYLGTADETRTLRTAPATFTLDATDPAGAVTLRGSIAADIDAQPAGSIAVDLRAADLLNPDGSIRTDALPRLAGTLTADDVPTALAQPFVADKGLDLPTDLGPTIRVSLVADAPASDEPARVTLTARAAKLDASGTAILTGTQLTTDGPVRVELLDPAPTLVRLLADAPATITRTGALDVTFTDVRVDTARLRATPPDLAGATARARMRVGPVEGTLAREGADPVAFRIPRTAYDSALADDALTLETSYPSLRLADTDAIGPTDVALRIDAPLTRHAFSGTLTMTRVDGPALARALADERAEQIASDLGPMFTMTLRPTLAAGEPMGLELDLVGAQIDATTRAVVSASGLEAGARVHRVGTGWLDAFTPRPGLAAAAMGQTASALISVTAGATPEGAFGVPFDASVELTSPRLKTTAPVRLRVTKAAAELMGPARLDMTIEPELFAVLTTTGDASGAPVTRLAGPTPLRVSISEAMFPLAPGSGAPLAARAELSTDAFTLIAPDGTEQPFTALAADAHTTNTPGQLALNASLSTPDAENETLTAKLTIDNVSAVGATPADPAITGFVRARQLPTPLIDAFGGTGGTAARMLGPRANVRVDLDKLPREGGTVTATLGSPNAQLDYAASVQGERLVNTAPATVTLKRIEQEFGFEITKFIPVLGGLTKAPSDQPATFTIPTIALPIDGDLTKITLDLTADPGTGTIQLERGLAGLIDQRLVQQGRTLGDSFEPFKVTMDSGVLRVTEFTLPLGDFSIPAEATYDLNARTEDVVVRLPAGALIADALGGDLAPLKNILGSALNPPLRKRGTIGADNKWKIDPSWKPPASERKDPAEQILDGLGGLLRDQLERDKKNETPPNDPETGDGG